MRSEFLLQEWGILGHPPAERGVVNLHTALFHHFLELAVADRIRHVPADTPQDDIPFKMAALELDRHLLAPRKSPPASIPQAARPETCDRTERGDNLHKVRTLDAAFLVKARNGSAASNMAHSNDVDW